MTPKPKTQNAKRESKDTNKKNSSYKMKNKKTQNDELNMSNEKLDIPKQ